MMTPLRQTDSGKQVVGSLAGLAETEQLQRQQHVFSRRQISEQLKRLEDEADLVSAQDRQTVLRPPVDSLTLKADFPRARPIEPGHQGQQGRFSAARWTQHRDELTSPNVKSDVIEDRQHPSTGG